MRDMSHHSHSRNRVQPGVPEGGQFAAHRRAGADPSVQLVDHEQGYDAAKEAAVAYGQKMYEAGQARNNPKLSPQVQRESAEMITANAEKQVDEAITAIYGKDSPELEQARQAVAAYGAGRFNAGKIVSDPTKSEDVRAMVATRIVADADAMLYRSLPGSPLSEQDDEDLVESDPSACNSCGNYLPTDGERANKRCDACAELGTQSAVTFEEDGDEFSVDRTGEGHYTIYRNGNYLGEFYRAGDAADQAELEDSARLHLGL